MFLPFHLCCSLVFCSHLSSAPLGISRHLFLFSCSSCWRPGVYPGEEEAQEDLITIFQYLKDGYKEDVSSVLQVTTWRKQKGMAPAEALPRRKKYFFFYSDNNNHCNNLLRDMVEALSLHVFKMGLDRMLDNLIWVPSAMEDWTR